MKIFSGNSNKPLAKKIAKFLRQRLGSVEIYVFADEEKRVCIADKVVDEDCVVVQSTPPDVDKNYMELFFIADALSRNGAKSITAVIPYLGYQRQDHMFRIGEAVSLEVVIKILETVGVNKVITFDLHSVRIPELFKIPVVHLSALPLFAEKISEVFSSQDSPHLLNDSSKPNGNTRLVDKKAPSYTATSLSNTGSEKTMKSSFRGGARPSLSLPHFRNLVLVSPDMGGIRRIKILSKMLGNMPYAAVVKNRDIKTGKISVSSIEGEVKDNVIIVDDMISTGATIIKGADFLRKKGVKNLFVFATHPVFSSDAPRVLQESIVEKVYVTDTIDVPKEKRFSKLEVLSVAKIIATSLSS